MSHKKPPPLLPNQSRNRCPVCGEISYSSAGIHPQCSVRQADEAQKDRMKLEKQSEQNGAPAPPSTGVAPWQKVCPKCKAVQHVRKLVCVCGHTFPRKARPPSHDDERIS